MNIQEKLFPPNNVYQIWLLLDPDDRAPDTLADTATAAEEEGASVILVGGSFLSHDDFDSRVKLIKSSVSLPVVLFPGSSRQLSAHADGILFMSLLSGRNPQYLIGEQVMAAPIICRMGIKTIPTAYLLIESGSMTSTEYVSNTKPIPRNKPELVVAHAQAAKLFGMQAVYLEAGSGAELPVPVEIIKAVHKSVDIPLIVGGGIRKSDQCIAAAKAGANAIVIGTGVERGGRSFVREMVSALKGIAK